MIRINKSLATPDTPPSLRRPFKENFAPGNISRPAKTTTKRRNEMIRAGMYIDNDNYNSRYKIADIKIRLKNIYNNKCAYCEQKLEQFHVEHYRPKTTYFWLAYSWDNLISACPTCNIHKDINFRINGPIATMAISLASFNALNTNALSATYNVLEDPDLVNPEITDPSGNLRFGKLGEISSPDPKFDYTITTCKIDRTYLKDNRRKILEDLRNDLKTAFLMNPTTLEQEAAIKAIVEKFFRDSREIKNEFIAYRKFIIANWIAAEIKDAKN